MSHNESVCDLMAENGKLAARQQLVARIKRTSKYSHQAPPGEWFDVRLSHRYPVVSGNSNAYEKSDVVFGIRLENGTVVELK